MRLKGSDDNEYNRLCGQRLRQDRIRRHLTQEQVAEAMRLSLRQLRRYEAGECNFKIDMFTKLEQAGLETKYILLGQTKEDIAAEHLFGRLSLEDQERVSLFLSGSLDFYYDKEKVSEFLREIGLKLKSLPDDEDNMSVWQNHFHTRFFTNVYEQVDIEEYYEMLEQLFGKDNQ